MEHYYGFREEGSIEVTAYVRPTLLLEPMDAKLETLRTLAAEDIVDALAVEHWPGKVPLSAGTVYDGALDAFDRFERWADANGASIRPPFTVRAVTSEFREETYSVVRTPIMCLEVDVDGELAGVFPHTRDGTEHDVTEAIAALRANSLLVAGSTDVDVERFGSCPRCEGGLVRVQGVELCHDCAWSNWDDVVGAEDEQVALERRSSLVPGR